MFCFKCGQQIADNSQFCSHCGTAQNINAPAITTNPQNENKDLERDALNIYLSNVLALECFIQKLNADFDVVNEEITKFEAKNHNERFHCSGQNYAWFRYDGEKFYLYFSADNKGQYFLGMHKELYYDCFGVECRYAGDWFPIDENLEYLNNQANFPDNSYSSVVGAVQRRATKKAFWDAYNEFKSTGPQKYQENLNLIKPSMNKRSGIENEITEAKELLQKAYDINIIPKQFRNIYAVWFIHDYIATSTESLASAFLQCNLDEIKQKLDTIIEQQKEIIINQQILMAQNTQMIEQNQQMLNRLAKIENNTERAAQYAKIASNNAEACAWIGLANYIKE